MRFLFAILFGPRIYCSRLHPHYTKQARDMCDALVVEHAEAVRGLKPGQAPPILTYIREV